MKKLIEQDKSQVNRFNQSDSEKLQEGLCILARIIARKTVEKQLVELNIKNPVSRSSNATTCNQESHKKRATINEK